MIKLIVTLFFYLHLTATSAFARTVALLAPLLTWVGGVAEATFRPLNAVIDRIIDHIHEAFEDAYKGVNYTEEELFLGGWIGTLILGAILFLGLLFGSGNEKVYLHVDKGCYITTSSVEGCIVDASPGDEGVMIMIGYLR